MKHLVRGHYWHNELGRMLVEDRIFESFDEAKEFVNASSYHSFKVFDENNELVHSGNPGERPSYA